MVSAAQTFPLVCFFLYQLSGLPAVLDIVRKQSTGFTSPVTFVMLILNGFVWTSYGVLLEDEAILISNVSCLLFGILYSGVFYTYATDRRVMRYYLIAVCMAVTLIFWTVVNSTLEGAKAFTGGMGAVISVLTMSSPLVVMGKVIREQNSSYLPIPITACGTLSTLSWLLYGVFLRDVYMIVPNTLGFLAGLIQICLIFAFPREKLIEYSKVKLEV